MATKKPLVQVHVACPNCSAGLQVTIYRRRLNPPEPPQYEYEKEVQLLLARRKGGRGASKG